MARLDCDCEAFIKSLVDRLDPTSSAPSGSVFKDDVYKGKGYIREGQDIYNSAVLFALQRLQNEINDCYGEDAYCPCIVIADSRQRGGQDNRLRKFVDNAMGGTGGIWVNFEKSVVEGSCEEEIQGGGCLYLLSSGKSPLASFFADASATCADAFIATSEAGLVRQDQDGLFDIFDRSSPLDGAPA